MKFAQFSVVFILSVGMQNFANAGVCSAQVHCANASASCSIQSTNTGDGTRNEAYCGELEPGDKFLSCWLVKKSGILSVSDIICCDKNGNAHQGGWSSGTTIDTSACISH